MSNSNVRTNRNATKTRKREMEGSNDKFEKLHGERPEYSQERENGMRETESLITAAQNHTIKTKWVECSPRVQETWVQSQVASYQRL